MFTRLKFSILLVLILSTLFTGRSSAFEAKRNSTPQDSSQLQRARYLRMILEERFDSPEVRDLDSQNKEWRLFLLSFTSFAHTNLAQEYPFLADTARVVIARGIELAATDEMAIQFSSSLHPHPFGSVLYLGHLNLMLGCYRLVGGDHRYDELSRQISEFLSKEYEKSPIKNLETYSSMVWPADNTVALASLHIYDLIHKTTLGNVTMAWSSWMQSHMLSKDTGLMNSQIDLASGNPLAGPRGCAIAWSILFINQFDPIFAASQYDRFKKCCVVSLGPVVTAREYPGDSKTSIGDIDSGPIIFGFGVASTGFTLGAARSLGDEKTAAGIERLIQWVDAGTSDGVLMHYRQYSPLSDALLLFAQTARRWDARLVR